MKKVLSLTFMALALIAFASSSAFAGPNCGSDKAKKASADKAACSSHTNAIKASASATCTPEELEACAKKMGVTVEEYKKMCGENGSLAMHTISIEGMTCGSCEASLTKVIEGVAGVKRVVSISHKDASAVVCVEKSSISLTTLTKAISDKGYKAEIISAVATTSSATTSTVSADGKKDCSKTCSTAEKAACDSKSKETAKNPEDTK